MKTTLTITITPDIMTRDNLHGASSGNRACSCPIARAINNVIPLTKHASIGTDDGVIVDNETGIPKYGIGLSMLAQKVRWHFDFADKILAVQCLVDLFTLDNPSLAAYK